MLQKALTTDLMSLGSIQPTFHQTELLETYDVEDPHAESFDDLGDEVNPSVPDATEELNHIAISPERRPLYLPSSYKMNENHPLCQAELTLQIKQATQCLAVLREAVAEKSFQYLHVMCKAPSKSLQTRTQAVIVKISDRMSHYSRAYSRA